MKERRCKICGDGGEVMDGVLVVMELLGAHGLTGVVDGGGEELDTILTMGSLKRKRRNFWKLGRRILRRSLRI
jgi:hypothetical protein